MSEHFDVRSEILSQISKTDDENLRVVLLLLLGVLDEIGGKIDTVLADEQSLRQTVLNGHHATHDDDHHWIKARRADDCAAACAWAKEKMAAEATAAADRHGIARRFLEAIAAQAGAILATAALVAAGFTFVK